MPEVAGLAKLDLVEVVCKLEKLLQGRRAVVPYS